MGAGGGGRGRWGDGAMRAMRREAIQVTGAAARVGSAVPRVALPPGSERRAVAARLPVRVPAHGRITTYNEGGQQC